MHRLTPALVVAALVSGASALAQQSAPESQVRFMNVYVFDGANKQRIESGNVLVEGDLIRQISTEKISAAGAILS